MQSHGITLSFHREMADSSRELVGPDITAAVTFESYPRFIKGIFQDYEGLGIKRSTADSKHVPSPRSRLLGKLTSRYFAIAASHPAVRASANFDQRIVYMCAAPLECSVMTR